MYKISQPFRLFFHHRFDFIIRFVLDFINLVIQMAYFKGEVHVQGELLLAGLLSDYYRQDPAATLYTGK